MNINKYETKDLGEAAALRVSGLEILGVERRGNVCWFIFDKKDVCEDTSRAFWYGQLTVNAKSYHDMLIALKNRIFAEAWSKKEEY